MSRYLSPLLFLLVLSLADAAFFAAEVSADDASTDDAFADGIYTYGEASRDGRGKFYMGREISHTMSYHGIPWLERPERVREEMPDEVVVRMNLNADDTVVDLGAGSGYFTFRIAAAVPQGRVLAVDIQPEMLAALEDGARKRDLANVQPILGEPDDPKLPDGSVNALLMVDVYHEVEHPHELMQRVVKALVPGGRIILVEYRGEDRELAIKPLHKMTQAQVKKEMQAVGLEWVETLDFLPNQHFFVFRAPVSSEAPAPSQSPSSESPG